jgi:hypothetical protein
MKRGIVLLILPLAIWCGCTKQPGNTADSEIALKLELVGHPAAANIFAPGEPALGKSAGVVEDEVLLLHCDEDSGLVANDASAYGNDFTLYDVTRDTAAIADDGWSLRFNGRNSYALSESYDTNHSELDGTHGLTIYMKVYPIGSDLYYEKRLLDRRDFTGGYAVGINMNHFYFSVVKSGEVITKTGTTTLAPRTWYTIVARFADGVLSLTINGNPDGEPLAFGGPVSPSTRQTVIGAGWTPTSGIPTYNFNGRIDEVSIRSAVEYEDFESLRVAVIDIADYSNVNAFMGSEKWQHYQLNFYNFFSDTTKLPTWEHWKKLWTNSGFSVYSEQTLTVRGAFAEGQVRGVEGLNLLALAGIQKGEITYYGTGYVVVVPGGINEAVVQMWPAAF